MKRAVRQLDELPIEVLEKILSAANVALARLDDRTPLEEAALEAVGRAITTLELDSIKQKLAKGSRRESDL